jgi:hypothetical protein
MIINGHVSECVGIGRYGHTQCISKGVVIMRLELGNVCQPAIVTFGRRRPGTIDVRRQHGDAGLGTRSKGRSVS